MLVGLLVGFGQEPLGVVEVARAVGGLRDPGDGEGRLDVGPDLAGEAQALLELGAGLGVPAA